MGRTAVVIGTAFLLTGCGSGNGTAVQAEPSVTRTSTTAECLPLVGGSTRTQERPPGASVQAIFLTDVQVEATDCTDRVVFTFREDAGEIPGYTVSYEAGRTAKIEDGSGRRLEIAGSAFLVVRFTNAMTAEISGDKVTPTYKGPRRIIAEDTRFVREVAKTGDFESTVTWVIGLDEKRAFTAAESVANERLIVDID